MDEDKFECNETKNLSNFDKHKIDFDFASNVFSDNKRIEWEDDRNDYGEIRFISIGKIVNAIITVVYTMRNNKIRIISARPAKKQERDLYNNQN
jgi:uncharacterized DUF497 family protein